MIFNRSRPKTYLETSVISYLAARPSANALSREHQAITHEWWERRRHLFDLYTSEIVVAEIARGNTSAAEARIAYVKPLEILHLTDEASELSHRILSSAALPPKATADALHIAIATVNAMELLLTWNCRHIANAMTLRRILAICQEMGLEPPIVCTPEEAMEG